MPARDPCPACKQVGFVGFETVVRAEETYRHFYCGRCNHTWQIAETDRRRHPRGSDDKPERSRLS